MVTDSPSMQFLINWFIKCLKVGLERYEQWCKFPPKKRPSQLKTHVICIKMTINKETNKQTKSEQINLFTMWLLKFSVLYCPLQKEIFLSFSNGSLSPSQIFNTWALLKPPEKWVGEWVRKLFFLIYFIFKWPNYPPQQWVSYKGFAGKSIKSKCVYMLSLTKIWQDYGANRLCG